MGVRQKRTWLSGAAPHFAGMGGKQTVDAAMKPPTERHQGNIEAIARRTLGGQKPDRYLGCLLFAREGRVE